MRATTPARGITDSPARATSTARIRPPAPWVSAMNPCAPGADCRKQLFRVELGRDHQHRAIRVPARRCGGQRGRSLRGSRSRRERVLPRRARRPWPPSTRRPTSAATSRPARASTLRRAARTSAWPPASDDRAGRQGSGAGGAGSREIARDVTKSPMCRSDARSSSHRQRASTAARHRMLHAPRSGNPSAEGTDRDAMPPSSHTRSSNGCSRNRTSESLSKAANCLRSR